MTRLRTLHMARGSVPIASCYDSLYRGGITIKIKLTLPIPPSVNHCYKNIPTRKGVKNRILTEEASNWKQLAAWTAKSAIRSQGWSMPDAKQKIILELYAYWPDNHRRDMNNCHKLLCDALESWLYLDDKMVLVRDIDFTIDRKNPRIEVCVYPKE